jgi:2-polyprenyl-3-methyl-5-hydroxy-6-metoxy-1,4-benzoquinol methylase
MNKEFWNERYGNAAFAYGKTANDFLQTQEFKTGSKILCLAEGEGRNGVFLAKQGHKVTCIDYSESGIKKMQELAVENEVELTTICADLNDVQLEPNAWDSIIIIFGHFPSNLRKHVHSQVFNSLKPNGKLILEAYHKDQVQYKTGGPMTTDLLYSEEEMNADFNAFANLKIQKEMREVHEGEFHFGKAAVIQVIGIK